MSSNVSQMQTLQTFPEFVLIMPVIRHILANKRSSGAARRNESCTCWCCWSRCYLNSFAVQSLVVSYFNLEVLLLKFCFYDILIEDLLCPSRPGLTCCLLVLRWASCCCCSCDYYLLRAGKHKLHHKRLRFSESCCFMRALLTNLFVILKDSFILAAALEATK